MSLVVLDNHQQMINFASSSSSSSSSSMKPPRKYDVFLSFRGEDTRDNFTSHLHGALSQAKVETYIDNRLEKGDEISQALIKAIKDSHVSVVIFSENYASSKWCLDEITKILECKKDHGQVVIPVFYKIDPSHVRKQTGNYKEAFAKHEQDLKNSDDKLQKWKCALTEAANLAGWDSRNCRNEYEFTKGIVKDVLQKLNNRYPTELKGVVAIEENYAKVVSLLKIGSIDDDVRVIGIWGMGGIGKTTLARALYAKLSSQFEGQCFLERVREQSKNNGLDALRKRLFSELLGEENLCVTGRHKVFIVLDDVTTSEQLDYLIFNCLAGGSRVIITTRDKHIFRQVSGIYEVKELNAHASLHLFCLNAFQEEGPKIGYEELSKRVIAYCRGNPLALKVLGARLQSRSIEAWQSDLRKLQKFPDVNIHNVLKLSFDDLDPTEKDIFLDIACLLKKEFRDYVTSLLDACGFYATVGIENLMDKSLLFVTKYDTIEMHDLIQEMGQNIVCKSDKDPGKRSRLWDPEEVYDVLKNNKGTEAVECIILDVSKIKKDLHLSFNSFAKMSRLRILIFYPSRLTRHQIYLPNGLESLSDELRHLEWRHSNLESLPSTFCAENLVKLCMPHSKLKKLWDGVQNLQYLKEINLNYSKDLVELPDLSQATNLEVLLLSECISLREVHPSILSLHKLTQMDLSGCDNLESFGSKLSGDPLDGMSSLTELHLQYCCNLRALPDSIGSLTSLEWLDLSGCINVEMLSPNIKNLLKLHTLELGNCKKLVSLPELPPSLRWLSAINTPKLKALPDNIGLSSSLEWIHLSGSGVEMLSPNIKNLLKLKMLWLNECTKLVSLPKLPPSLQELSAINCTSLQTDLFTQFLQVVNRDDDDDMLMELAYKHNPWTKVRSQSISPPRYVIFPGAQVPDIFRFRAEGNSITHPQLPLSGLRGFICCLVLSHITPDSAHGYVNCYINKSSTSIKMCHGILLGGQYSILDHVLLCYAEKLDYFIWKSIQGRPCDPNTMTFEFSYTNAVVPPLLPIEFERPSLNKKIEIKRCGVFPLYYATQDLEQTIPITDDRGCKRKSPSFEKEENSRCGKQIIRFDIDLNETIEESEGED